MALFRRQQALTATITLLVCIFVFVGSPYTASAQEEGGGFGLFSFLDPLGLVGDAAEFISGVNPVDRFREVAKFSAAGGAYAIMLAIGGWSIKLTGQFLDVSIAYLVIGMGALMSGSLGDAIDDLWSVVRDVFNILFIFGLIYIGFRTILNIGTSTTRKMLIGLIAAAILVNFSLYITKAIVDVTNVTAYQIYELMDVPGGGVLESVGITEYESISSGFLQALKLQTLSVWSALDLMYQVVQDGGSLPSGRLFVYGILIMLFSVIASVAFIAGGILLVGRFIALIIFMVFSPAMFLGWIFPGLASYSKRWWKGFMQYALIAPAFMFMLYLSLSIANALQTNESGLAVALLAPSNSSGSTFVDVIVFAVIIGLIIASVMVAKQMSDVGATQIGAAATAAQKYVYGGMSGFAGRNTIGRGGSWASDAFKAWQGKPDKERSGVGRAMRTGLKATGFDRTIAQGAESARSAKFGSSTSRKDVEDFYKKRGKDVSQSERAQRLRDSVSGAEPWLNQNRKDLSVEDQAKYDASIVAMEESIQDAQKGELVELASEYKAGSGKSPLFTVADSLSQKQFDALQDSDEVSDEFKDMLRTQRSERTAKRLGITDVTTAAGTKNIQKATKPQLHALNFETLMSGARWLQDAQMEDLKSSTLTPYQLELLKEKRKRDILVRDTKGSIPVSQAVEILKSRKNDKEIAKLPNEFLESPSVAAAFVSKMEDKLTVSLLRKIASESDANKLAISSNIREAYANQKKTLPKNIEQYFDSNDGLVYGARRE